MANGLPSVTFSWSGLRRLETFHHRRRRRKGQSALTGAKFHWTWQKFIFALVQTYSLGLGWWKAENISIREFFSTIVAQHQHMKEEKAFHDVRRCCCGLRSASTCEHVRIGMLIKISSDFIGQYKREFQFLYFSSDWIQIKVFVPSRFGRVRRARSFRLMVEFLNWNSFFGGKKREKNFFLFNFVAET